MRPLVSWMTRSDDAILELLATAGLALPPAVIAFNADVSRPTVQRRLKKLLAHGLVEKAEPSRGYYRITDLGESYLAGDVDADDLEP